MRDALDFSFHRPEPEQLVGYDALSYCGGVRPPADWLARCRDLGVAFTFIMETIPNRSQQGYQAGVYDAQFADARVDAVGYPRDASVCYVVSDGNAGDPSPWNSDPNKIADYGEGVAFTSLRPFFFYGNRYAVDAAIAGARRVPMASLLAGPRDDGGWLPVTWGADPQRDLLIQQANTPAPIEGTDLNTVHAPYTGIPAVPPAPQTTEDSMLIRRAENGPEGSNQPAGHTELLDGFGGQWHEDSYNTLPNVPAVSNLVWDQVHAMADTRGQQLTSAAGSTGQGGGPSDAQRAAVDKTVALLSGNGAREAEAAHELATAFG